jgi:hypothetical protein
MDSFRWSGVRCYQLELCGCCCDGPTDLQLGLQRLNRGCGPRAAAAAVRGLLQNTQAKQAQKRGARVRDVAQFLSSGASVFFSSSTSLSHLAQHPVRRIEVGALVVLHYY